MSETAFLAAGALLSWLFAVYSVSLFSLLAGLGIWRHAATACLVAIPIWLISARTGRDRTALWQVFIAALLVLLILVSGYQFATGFIDHSWDGTAYHQQAILQMVEGWPGFPERLDPLIMYHQQLDHYPKAAWIIGASIYQAGGNIESAKLLQFVFLAGAFLIGLAALVKVPRYPVWLALPTALAAALNPVTLYQSLSFYVDGPLSSLLVTAIGLIVLIVLEPRRRYLLLLAAVAILTINLKQTGVVFIGILLLTLVGLIFKTHHERFLATVWTAIISVAAGFLLYGYSPYVTNTVNHGNPVYPILGRDGVDFEQGHRPPGFDERSGVDRLVRSTFSAPTMAVDVPENLQPPFTFTDKKHLQVFRGADIRLGGWGVLFSGALVLSLLSLPLLIFTPSPARSIGLVTLGAVILTVLINPEAWWARFSPQWYLVALIPAALLALARKLPVQLIGGIITAILLVNSALVAYIYFPQQKTYTADLQEFLGLVKGIERPVIVYFGEFPSNRIRLEDAGITYRMVETPGQLPCRTPHDIFAYQGLFCVEGER